MNENIKRILVSLLPTIIFLYTISLLILYRAEVRLAPVIPCTYPSEVSVNQPFPVRCYGTYPIDSPGTYSFELPLYTDPVNIIDSSVRLIIYQMTFIPINISGSLPPDTTRDIYLSIPTWSEYVEVYGKIYGKPVDNDYPDYPYIKGGTRDLLGTIDTKFTGGLIIDRPGEYYLKVYSGRGGNGVDFIIDGKYGAYPSIAVYLNNYKLFEQERVSSSFPLTPSKERFTYGTNKFDIYVGKVGGFNVSFYLEYSCIVSLGDTNCFSYYDEATDSTIFYCFVKAFSTCDLESMGTKVKVHYTDMELSMFDPAKATILSSYIGQTSITYSDGYFIIPNIPKGESTITIVYSIPGKHTVMQKFGACIIKPTKIVAAGSPGTIVEPTLYISNIGTSPISVELIASEEIAPYVYFIPRSKIIQPGTYEEFTIRLEIPPIATTGYITVKGCADATIDVELKPGAIILDIAQLLFPSIASIGLFLFLRRRGMNIWVSLLLSIALLSMLFIGFRFVFYQTII